MKYNMTLDINSKDNAVIWTYYYIIIIVTSHFSTFIHPSSSRL